MRQDERHLLEIYLNDHWAGAAAGKSLADRLLHNNRDTEWGERLGWLVSQIEQDDAALDRLRAVLGMNGGRTKRILAIALERAARLKLNGRVFAYSPLSRVLECEGMEAGVSAKRRLWAALLEGPASVQELEAFDFEHLMKRADEQLELLRSFHAYAVSMAFGRSGDGMR